MSDINPNCDGAHCIKETAQVRVYPLGAGGNLYLCFECWANENRYRYEKNNQPGADPDGWPQHNWFEAKEAFVEDNTPDSYSEGFIKDDGSIHHK